MSAPSAREARIAETTAQLDTVRSTTLTLRSVDRWASVRLVRRNPYPQAMPLAREVVKELPFEHACILRSPATWAHSRVVRAGAVRVSTGWPSVGPFGSAGQCQVKPPGA